MKTYLKYLFAALLSSAVLPLAGAQTSHIVPIGNADSPASATALEPLTTIYIDVVLEKETVICGPYARYAQKYLGVMAPLADKVIYRIAEASLGYTGDGAEAVKAVSADGVETDSHVRGDGGFTKATPDKVSFAERSMEDMAREAANTIFTLRKRRFDLVTGEAGEHVYGAGMAAALEEMERLEEEYLVLFLGKRTVEKTTRRVEVIPSAGRGNYVLFRFSDSEGILPGSDLSGTPVLLTVKAENGVQAVPCKEGKGVMYYRVADFAECTLLYESRELAHRRIPVLQNGVTVGVVPAGR